MLQVALKNNQSDRVVQEVSIDVDGAENHNENFSFKKCGEVLWGFGIFQENVQELTHVDKCCANHHTQNHEEV